MSAETTSIMEEPATVERDTTQLVVFTLTGEEYGVEILGVRRIIKAEAITMIPNAPDFLKGVINLRSQIIGVIDLEKRFLLERDEEHISKHILIVEAGNSTYGLLVDEVTEILRLAKDDIKPAPQIITEKLGAEFVQGVGTVGDKSEKELVELSKMSAKGYPTAGPKKKEKETTEQRVSDEKLPKKKRTTKREASKQKFVEETNGLSESSRLARDRSGGVN